MNRIFHPWTKWECFRAGFFLSPGGKAKAAEDAAKCAAMMRNHDHFERALLGVLRDWPYSCEHNLSNESMNRVAWLGQASGTHEFGCSALSNCSAFVSLTKEEQATANEQARRVLKLWLSEREANNVSAQAV